MKSMLNKRFFMVLVVFVVLPIVLAFLNYYYSGYDNFRWGYDNVNQISTGSLVMAIIACGYIIGMNHRTYNSKAWYLIASIIGVFLLFYLYLLQSLSDFGF